MADCNHNCGSCSENCSERDPKSLLKPLNAASSVGKVYAIVSGKGGVGKSMVTQQLAVLANRAGHKTAIMDADITGPSIPRAFGLEGPVMQCEDGIIPAETESGIKVISINLMLQNETDPVIWRGPVIAGAVGQFWTDVVWGDVDCMFVDLPPGTGDVALTVFQSLPLDGIIIVTSPQELVSMVVEKAVKMANTMNVPIKGIVENMSYVECPDCGKQIHIFGEGKTEEAAAKYGLPILAKLPIKPELAAAVDRGEIETATGDHLSAVLAALTAGENIN